MANECTYKKLNDGTWGISGRNLTVGQTVVVRKKSGETKRETVAAIKWKGSDGFCYASIVAGDSSNSSGSNHSTQTRSTTRRTSSGGSRRRSRREPKHEGSSQGKYMSSREGDDGDTVGRVCYLKNRGTRIPVVVVGWETGYCQEDGLSMSLPMDEGYYTQVWYRDATEQEAKDLEAQETAKNTAKANAEQSAKATLEAAKNTARAPLEGLIKSDSLLTPKGVKSTVGSYKDGLWTTTVTKIEMENGLVVYEESATMYDDFRTYLWGTKEALGVLYEQRLAENPITLEAAREYLAKYSGCYGATIYQYVVDKETPA